MPELQGVLAGAIEKHRFLDLLRYFVVRGRLCVRRRREAGQEDGRLPSVPRGRGDPVCGGRDPGGATWKWPWRPAVPLAALQDYPLIVSARPHAMRMHVETQMANLGLKMKVAWEIDGVSTILDLVRRGHGHAMLPIHALAGREGLAAQPLVKPRLASVLALGTSAQRPLTPLARAVTVLLRELTPARYSKSI
ncbi:MAG: LysR substrate-binding domain-containing protein [Burkholderiales bacterium]